MPELLIANDLSGLAYIGAPIPVVELRPPSFEHIAPIAARMRDWDRIEAAAMGHSPERALKLGMAASVDCYTVMIDGEPEGMLGLVPANILEREGQPWLLGSEAINEHPRALLVLSRSLVAIWRDSLPNLSNLVAAENHRTIRYLRRLGFAVGEDRVSVGGVDFVKFAIEAE